MTTLAAMTEDEARRLREYRAKKRGGPPREPKPHGTTAAIRRHERDGEPLCEPCRAEQQRYNAEQYEKRKAKASPPSTGDRSKKGKKR
jgi:hypothetical protein